LIKPNLSFEVFLTKNQYELYIGADWCSKIILAQELIY
jgi:hypothetical protein